MGTASYRELSYECVFQDVSSLGSTLAQKRVEPTFDHPLHCADGTPDREHHFRVGANLETALLRLGRA